MKTILSITLFVFMCFSIQAHTQNGLHFDGIDDYVSTLTPGISGNTAKTVEAWIKTTANSNPSSGGVQKVILDMGTASTGGRFTLNLLWNNALRLEVSGNGVSDNLSLSDGVWHHVAAVYDPTATNKVKLYVDGNLRVSSNLTVPVYTGTGNLVIGRRIDGINHFEGSIDEVRVWNTALSHTDILVNYNEELCSAQPYLYAYFKLNEGTASSTNTGISIVPNYIGADGMAQNFMLSGSTSNWVTGATISSATLYASNIVTVYACNSYTTPSGKIISNSGVYDDTLSSVMGCDSIQSYDVYLSNNTIYGYDTVSACDTYVYNGTTYDPTNPIITQTYTASNGCDSVVEVYIDFSFSNSSNVNLSGCTPYAAPNGDIWTSSGTYYDTLTNSAGCDSFITYNFSAASEVYDTTSISSCGDYIAPDGTLYNQSTQWNDTLNSSNGCDSIHTTQITIITIDTSITNNGNSLSANNTTASSYQWVLCPNLTPVQGANSSTFSPTVSGNYALIISEQNCRDTSGCHNVLISSIKVLSLQDETHIAPMPIIGNQLQLYSTKSLSNCHVVIYDILGKKISTQSLTVGNSWKLSFEHLPGVYILMIYQDSKVVARHRVHKM